MRTVGGERSTGGAAGEVAGGAGLAGSAIASALALDGSGGVVLVLFALVTTVSLSELAR